MSQAVTEQEMGTLLSILSRVESADQLARLREALNHRQMVVGSKQIRSIKVGNHVEWNGKAGHQKGVVQKIKQKYVEVKADVPAGSHALGMVWNVPASMLTIIP